jgi:hypothetical protein
MPTARELLEQADALMRRNRERDLAPPKVEEAAPPPAPAVDDDIPELTEVAADSLPGAEAAAAQELAIARAAPETGPVAGVALPELPAAAPVVAARAAEPADTAELLAGPADELPPLREALARDMPAPPAGSYPPPVALPPTSLDDIPELTEIVEEIEAPSILDATGEFDLGEPSVWMEAGHGEVSILGPWPGPPEADADHGDADLAAMIGAASESAPEANEAIGILHVAPELLDAELAAALPIDSAMAPPAAGDDGIPAAEVVAPLETEPEAEPVDVDGDAASDLRVEPSAFDVVAADIAVDARVGELEAANEANEAPLDGPFEEAAVREAEAREAEAREAEAREEEAREEEAREEEARAAETREAEAESAAPPTPAAVLPASAAARFAVVPDWQAGGMVALAGFTGATPDAPAAAAAAKEQAEDERWDRIAEEVRMQVLQRIDLFTDTGLQEQLARRLQPIVDRASGELVTAINQHVGQLMRAYVAEAIEREIEKWRAGGL